MLQHRVRLKDMKFFRDSGTQWAGPKFNFFLRPAATPRALYWTGLTGPRVTSRTGSKWRAQSGGPCGPRVEGLMGPLWRARRALPLPGPPFPPPPPPPPPLPPTPPPLPPNGQMTVGYSPTLPSPLQRSHDRCTPLFVFFFHFFFLYKYSTNSLNFSCSLQIHFIFTICSHIL